MPVTDTTVHADSSAKTATTTPAQRPSAGSDSGAKHPPAPAHEPKKMATQARPARDTAAPAGKPAGDTAASAPAPSPAKQDTSAAAAAAESGGELRDAYHQAPRDTVSQAVYDGWKQFNLNCARCHGEDVLGTTIAPHLIVSLKPNGPINSKELFVQTVCAGRPAKGMPAWCALGLDMDKINNIYQYVKGRSDAKIGPGRPAVKREG
jgi:mono/diheme cytochrome c family protein